MTASDKKNLNVSRQERFLKAVELLDSARSYTRLGGVHALVALADEYLTDQALQAEEKHAEGQRIVDILCAYIRSPFEMAFRYDELSQNKPSPHGVYRDNHQDFYMHKAEFWQKQRFVSRLCRKFTAGCTIFLKATEGAM